MAIKLLTILFLTLNVVCLRYFSEEKKICLPLDRIFLLKPLDEVDSLLVQLLSGLPDLAQGAELRQVQEALHVVR